MLLGHPELPLYWVEVITRDYRLYGGLQPIGPILGFLNDVQWQYIQLRDATLAAFDAENPLGKRQFPLLMIRKEDIVALCLLDEETVNAANLLTTMHSLIVYTSRFIVKGDFRMYADDIPLTVLNSSLHDFIAATNTSLYPLTRVLHAPSAAAPAMLVNRKHVSFYLPADEE